MKKILLFTAFILITAALTISTSCEDNVGSEPTGVTLTAENDTLVKITWTASAEGAPDKYIIYFKAVGAASYTNVDEVTATTYTHSPAGATGDYYVSAKFGTNEYDSDVKSTIPVNNTSVDFPELHASGNAGYGWSRTGGTKTTYSMITAASAINVDFYITNFFAGYTATPYYIASPSVGPTSADSTIVPTGSWRVNWFSNPITDPQVPLPIYSSTTYFNFTELTAWPTYVAVKTTDGYYALVKVAGPPSSTGMVQVESWFQLVKGLRLIKH